MICRKCGRTLPDDSLFCQYCGADLAELTAAAEPFTEEPQADAVEPQVEPPAEPAAETAKAAPAGEPEPAPTAEQKQPDGKARYCRECGGLVDPETKKCTKCGKQYFKFPTRSFLRGAIAVLLIGMLIGLVVLIDQNQFLKTELDEKTAEVARYESNYNANNDYWKKKYYAIIDEYQFYHNHAVIVQEDVTNYHSYGCPRLDYHYFWIYNTEAAIDRGYDPCPECQQ